MDDSRWSFPRHHGLKPSICFWHYTPSLCIIYSVWEILTSHLHSNGLTGPLLFKYLLLISQFSIYILSPLKFYNNLPICKSLATTSKFSFFQSNPDYVSLNCCSNSHYQLDWIYIQSRVQYGPPLPFQMKLATTHTVILCSSQMELYTISQNYTLLLKMFLCVPASWGCLFYTLAAETLLSFMSFLFKVCLHLHIFQDFQIRWLLFVCFWSPP